MPRLSLYLLGPTRVEQDGRPLEVDTRKAIALLAYLVTTGKGQPRDALTALLWPESDPYHASAGLRRTLSVLRNALAGDWLQTNRITIALPPAPDVWSDVVEFRTLVDERHSHKHPLSAVCPACLPLLAQSADLHRGDFMSNFGLRDSPDFDDWQMQQAESWRGELSHTLELLVQGYISQGDLESAISGARRWLALDRLNEAAHGQLMRLYAWTGRRPAALQQYQECARILQDQLGVLPQESLAALHDAIRSGGLRRPLLPAGGQVEAEPYHKPQPASAAPPAPAATAQIDTVTEEKRIVTVLYADAGATFQGTHGAGAEHEAILVQRFVKVTEGILRRYNGHLARSAGVGVLAVFGSAQTHESDSELAVRAALKIREDARALGLTVTSGINTGEVLAGGADAPAGGPPALVGRAVDLAMRLAGQALAGQILVGEATYRLTRHAFAFAPRAAATTGAAPGGAYQVEQLLAQPGKARGIEGLQAKLTGRDEELARLKDALERARQGHGRIVSLIGEAGVGKSRLISELKQYALAAPQAAPKDYALAAGQTPLWLEGRCLDIGLAAAYTPFLDILRGFFAWTAQEDEDIRQESIASCLEGLATHRYLEQSRVEEIGALLCRLLSLPAEEAWEEKLKVQSPEQIRYRTFVAVRDFLTALARRQPIVLVFEDLHWADDLSLDLIGLLMEGLGEQAMLLLCAYRPEQEYTVRHLATTADQKCRDCYSELPLRELTQQQSRQLVASLLAIEALPSPVSDAVLGRSQGNPFFIEEVVRSLIDAGAIYREAENWRAHPEPGVLAVTDSVQSVILSRVDRLDPETKRVLQAAAVIGPLFRRRVLDDVVADVESLARILDDLIDSALIYQERTVPEVEYSFKHVLTQQAVYQNILSSRRAETHWRVAEAVEALYPDNLADYAEQLAYQYEQSGKVEKAVEYLLTAGEKAKRQYANPSAIAHLTHALDLLRTLPDSRERDRRELDLLIALGSPLTASKGYTAEETGRLYSRARDICLQLGDTTQLLPALHGLWRFHFNRMHLAEAHTLAREFMDLAQASQNPGLLLEAHRALGYTLQILGDIAGSLAHAQEGLALYDAGAYRPHSFVYGQDPATSLLAYAGVNQWILGYPDRALESAQRLLALAEESADPLNRAIALSHAVRPYMMRREWDEVEKHSSAAIKIATEHNYPFWLADASILHGRAISCRGHIAEGIAEVQRGLAMLQALGHSAYDRKLGLAAVYAEAGRIVDALSTVDELQRSLATIGAGQSEANIYRIKGDLILRLGRSEEAEACFQRALEIARSQQAKGWELRAATSLARLWQKRGKRDEAQALLQGVYSWFTEGFDTADLKDAQALLDELA